ncbi:hypothetical protein [Rhodococcus globerulus]|uniref:hypothetical protein n=1 Tax=Rhodococcus globerulus TaxID=33008 RepID=UPI001C581C65|nr:hypothetical protein [Rhodococcus globerulus]QXW04045.1 hypothetical protein KYT97_08500 [Rhodococcus globerulus]
MSTLIAHPKLAVVRIEPFKGGSTFPSIHLDELTHWQREYALQLKAKKSELGALYTVHYSDGTTDDLHSDEIGVAA